MFMAALPHGLLGVRLSPHQKGFFVPGLASTRHNLRRGILSPLLHCEADCSSGARTRGFRSWSTKASTANPSLCLRPTNRS